MVQAVAEGVRHLFDDPDRPAIVHPHRSENPDPSLGAGSQISRRDHRKVLLGSVDLGTEAYRGALSAVVEQFEHGGLSFKQCQHPMEFGKVLPEVDDATRSPDIDLAVAIERPRDRRHRLAEKCCDRGRRRRRRRDDTLAQLTTDEGIECSRDLGHLFGGHRLAGSNQRLMNSSRLGDQNEDDHIGFDSQQVDIAHDMTAKTGPKDDRGILGDLAEQI